MSKRILHIVDRMNRGGAETMIMNLFRTSTQNNIYFDFVSHTELESDFDKEIVKLGGRIYYIPPFKQNPIQYISKLREIIDGNYDVIHIHTLFNSGIALLSCSFINIRKKIVHAHSSSSIKNGLPSRSYRFLMRSIINLMCTDRIACSISAGNFLFGNKYGQNTVIINNAIDISQLQNLDYRVINKIKNELNCNDIPVIGMVGNLKTVKNHIFAIEIAKELKKKGNSFKMIFIGDGNLKPVLKKKISDLNLENFVFFLGKRTDVFEIMSFTKVLIMPSLYEGLPVTLIEAQSVNLPCIISSNISREADLGLNLIKFLPINEGAEIWAEKIEQQLGIHPINNKITINKDALTESGYLTTSSFPKLEMIYGFGSSDD